MQSPIDGPGNWTVIVLHGTLIQSKLRFESQGLVVELPRDRHSFLEAFGRLGWTILDVVDLAKQNKT